MIIYIIDIFCNSPVVMIVFCYKNAKHDDVKPLEKILLISVLKFIVMPMCFNFFSFFFEECFSFLVKFVALAYPGSFSKESLNNGNTGEPQALPEFLKDKLGIELKLWCYEMRIATH